MRARTALFWLGSAGAALSSVVARADEKVGPVAIDALTPGVCFDVRRLEERLRHKLPGVHVAVGESAAAGGTSVSLVRAGSDLEITISRRSPGGALRTDQRMLPANAKCDVLLETVTAIVARAVAPLGWRASDPEREAPPVSPPQTSPPDEKSPAPVPTTALHAPTEPPATTAPSRRSESTPPTTERRGAATPQATAPGDAGDGASIKRAAPLPPSRLQLGVAFRYALAPTDGRYEPEVLVSAGLRFRRWSAIVAGGVDVLGRDTASGAAVVATRRVPLFAGAAYELPVAGGALRFGLGALVELWTAASSGVAHPDQATVAHPGVFATLEYRLHLGRSLDLFIGVDGEYAFVTESFAVAGVGAVVATPSWWICPRAGLSLNFF